MRDMGLGGFFMHSRTGLATEYLGDEWFALTNACADEAASASGYSKRRLREFEAEGRLHNHGRKGSPLFRSGDLPRRTRAKSGFDAAAKASQILSGGRG